MSALAPNLLAFGRVLRRAGLPVGPAEALSAAEALGHVTFSDRAAFRAALRATMVHRRDHFEVFDAAFDLFWRNPDAPARPPAPGEEIPDLPAAARRASAAMPGGAAPAPPAA